MMDSQPECSLGLSAESPRYISDTIKVKVLGDRGGIFKFTAYEITSEKFKSKVERRYSDFTALNDHFVLKFTSRLIPKLPPKKVILSISIEERRKGLERWLRLLSQHPVLSVDQLYKVFMEVSSESVLDQMQSVFNSDPNEYLHLDVTAKIRHFEFDQVISKREFMKSRLSQVGKIKRLMELQAKREKAQSKDFLELSNTMTSMARDLRDSENSSFKDFSVSFLEISKESENVAVAQQNAVLERLLMIENILSAHSEMCDRVEKEHNLDYSHLGDENEAEMARQKAFSLSCVMEDTKFVENYLQLLPSILLQFSNEEAKSHLKVADIFNSIIEKESDKLN